MLGKFVRVRITNPVGSLNRQYGYRYSLNFGSLEGRRQFDNRFAGAYIMGIHPFRVVHLCAPGIKNQLLLILSHIDKFNKVSAQWGRYFSKLYRRYCNREAK